MLAEIRHALAAAERDERVVGFVLTGAGRGFCAGMDMNALNDMSSGGGRAAEDLSALQVAKLLRSSQSRVAKMEAGDPSVSLDLLVRSLLALGATRESLARTIRAAS